MYVYYRKQTLQFYVVNYRSYHRRITFVDIDRDRQREIDAMIYMYIIFVLNIMSHILKRLSGQLKMPQ